MSCMDYINIYIFITLIRCQLYCCLRIARGRSRVLCKHNIVEFIPKSQPSRQLSCDSAQHSPHLSDKHSKEKRSHGRVDEDDEDADPECVGVAACIDEKKSQCDGGKQRY